MKKALPFFLLLLALGCKSKLHKEQDVELPMVGRKEFVIPPITQEQTIHVSAKSNTGTFDVYIYLQKDTAAAEREIDMLKPGANVLAHKLKLTEVDDLQAVIPANEAAVVSIGSADGKKSEVKLKITN